ncbi:hypothetical protein Pth03_15560 [Planotetraspora thailandica]|uniref:Protein kinase domain-containing protein n=1 Tax=Planotetraspora thailandica TaxID=487172 RepID=A0A8J3XSF6_9ACTN|nr:serine/threonine-protein kinase [Planotetraspora thailandica]GII53167.1 hypothetical protein Pth03_15560 [Planotetraspora thailandica]
MPQVAPLGPGDPTELGPFVLTGRIGEGGQGVVYLGENEAGERAAVKLLHVKFSGDATARSRFARELRAAQRVAGFCTAGVVAADLEGDTPYIASEYIEGRSLRETVESDGPLTGAELERLAIGTATALIAIHHAGIVHRDFKPDNVLLAEDGPRVVDFGIARIVDTTGTVTSRAVGTPAYMAPEQISGEPVGPPADVFAWGSTMAFAATGTAVFGGSSIAAVLNRILNHDIDMSLLPPQIREVVRACLTKAAADRPTADEILLRLLGRPGSGSASDDVLAEGAQAANPETGVSLIPAYRDDADSAARTGPDAADADDDAAVEDAEDDAAGRTGGERADGETPGESTDTDWVAIFRGAAAPPPGAARAPTYPRVPPVGAADDQPRTVRFGTPPGRPPARPRTAGNRARWIAVITTVVALLATGGTVMASRMGLIPGGNAGPSGGAGTSTSQDPGTAPRLVSVADKAKDTGTLTIGVKGDLPGVGHQPSAGAAFVGLEIDVARYVAGKLGVQPSGITFRRISRGERAGLLKNGQVDMVVATYAYDQSREDMVTFAGPYYVAHTDVLVSSGSGISDLSDLAGRRVCAPQGSMSFSAVATAAGKLVAVPAENYAVCMDMLTAGTVDAVPGDDLILAGFAARVTGMKLSVLGLDLSDERYSVGLPPKDVKACMAVRDAVAEMYADGTMRSLLAKYFRNVDFVPEEATPPAIPCSGAA